MEALSLNFLELGRIQTRGVHIVPNSASLNEVVTDTIDAYRPILELRGLRARLELDPSIPAGWLDAPQLQRALANLVDNAIKFTPAGGEILCRTALEDDWLVVTIHDSGPGVPKDRTATLFSRFDSGKDVHGRRSTGLGLYISRAIVVAHGGEIALDDTVDQGACFRIRLPRKQKQSAPLAKVGHAGIPVADEYHDLSKLAS
jgi:signal transduction histidine kinase